MIPIVLIIEATVAIIREIIRVEERKTVEGKIDFIATQLQTQFPDAKLEIKDVEDLVDYIIVNKIKIHENESAVEKDKEMNVADAAAADQASS